MREQHSNVIGVWVQDEQVYHMIESGQCIGTYTLFGTRLLSGAYIIRSITARPCKSVEWYFEEL